MTSYDFNEVEDKLVKYVEQIGDTVQQRDIRSENTEEAKDVLFIRIDHGSNSLILLSREGERWFSIRFDYRLRNDLVRTNISEDEVDGPYVELNEEILVEAQEELESILKDIGDEEASKLKSKLIQLISNPEVSYEVHYEDNTPIRFEVTRKIFPYEENFGIREFYEGIQAVISSGIPGRLLMQNYFGFKVNEEEGLVKREE